MERIARNIIAGVLLISCTLQVYAQSNSECDDKLAQAEDEFAAGHFYSIPSLLGDCPDGNLSKEHTVRALLLLCQAYLILDQPLAADDSYLRLLHADPEYVADDKKDPIDVVYLSKKFTATPIFTPHFRAGVNTSFFRSIYPITVEPYGVSTAQPLQFGIQVGGGLDWNINDNVSLCAELDFSTKGYSRIRTDNLSAGDEATVVASQSWFDFPLYVKYVYNGVKAFRPFGYAGFAFNYLVSAKNEFSFVDKKASSSQLKAEGPNEDVKYQRNLLNRSWLIGGGIKVKSGKNFFYADLRYMGGLSNMANENQIYYADPKTNPDPNPVGNPGYYLSNNMSKYRAVSDVFRLDNLSLSVGYIHPLYNPRKVKRANTKSVKRKILKEEGGKGK